MGTAAVPLTVGDVKNPAITIEAGDPFRIRIGDRPIDNVVRIQLLPLWARKEDIPLLLDYYL